jgi:large subunit ribosomal protein L33
MADKKQTKVYLIPEGETRDITIENKKMRLKKFNPAKRVHEWFVEAKLPPHN